VDIDDLYGAPFDRFVPQRTELAKTLRKDGRRDEAAEVAALRKPSVAAWAVNQLIRTQARSVKDLFGAGDALAEPMNRPLRVVATPRRCARRRRRSELPLTR